MSEDLEQRKFFFALWEKIQSKGKMDTMEKQSAKVVGMHPELHPVLAEPSKFTEYEFSEEEGDPFGHLALHALLLELIFLDNPKGIRALYDRRINEAQDKHAVQHEFMESIFDWMATSGTSDESEVNMDELQNLLEHRFGTKAKE